MGKTATNLIVVLGLITVAFGGYYLYTQHGEDLSFQTDTEAMQNILRETNAFIAYGRTLNSITLDIDLFEDERFRSLRSFTTPIQDRPIGRPDPFADTPFTNSIDRNN